MLKRYVKREPTMRDRFMLRVLLPLFLLLLFIGGIGFWQLNEFLKDQAVDNLQTAAKATSIRLEREIVIREAILKNTANEITSIKSNYVSELEQLELSRTGCRDFYLQKYTFSNSPDGICDNFSVNIGNSRPSLALIEDKYIEIAKELQSKEINDVNQRLSAFKQFFPETMAVMLIDKNNEIVSSALSSDDANSSDKLNNYAISAVNQTVSGEIVQLDNFKVAVFAFPITGGSVLAAYDVNDPSYIRPSWQSTPIDNNEAISIVTESGKSIVYPGIRNEIELLSNTQKIQNDIYGKANLGGVQNIIVAEPVGDTNWKVLVASPEAIVYEQLRDTQLTVIFISGIFIVGFLWVGTFFIKRTTDNLAQLVTGAMVYGSGRLDYKLELNSSEKEFKQLADTMNYMAQRIAQSEKEIDERNKEFISIATHELRAPMTSIIGYLSMLKDNLDNKLNKQNTVLFDGAYEGTIKLRDLVNDMLDAARLEGGREEFSLKKLQISDYINDCLDSMKIVAKQNDITLNYDDKYSNTVFADESKLRIILNNFVSNAIKYNRHGGKVNISHNLIGDHLVVAIANNGPTIPIDQQAHMFEKFFRVDTPELKKVTGTGIGMYVTKQYIEVMNGKVWFTSNPGEDTIFYFNLPVSGKESKDQTPITNKSNKSNSKWIMRWRRHMR